jgi:hypothetical protein
MVVLKLKRSGMIVNLSNNRNVISTVVLCLSSRAESYGACVLFILPSAGLPFSWGNYVEFTKRVNIEINKIK